MAKGEKQILQSREASCEAGLHQRLQVQTKPDLCILSVTASFYPENLKYQQGQPNAE